MIHIHPFRIILLITILISFSYSTYSQFNGSKFWITISDGIVEWRLYFGEDSNATYGEDPQFYEIADLPIPPGPAGLLAYWKTIRFPSDWQTLTPSDIRRWSNNLQRDTFLLYFSNDTLPKGTIIFRWPDNCYLWEHCDSMFLIDPSNQIPIINMFSQDTLSISSAWLRGIDSLYIFQFGVHQYSCPLGVDEAKPSMFTLYQNYPNPFNPTTTIHYSIISKQYVSLKVYNIFGQVIATLITEVQSPGEKSVIWNGEHMASGVYFYKLQVGNYTEAKKMVLIR